MTGASMRGDEQKDRDVAPKRPRPSRMSILQKELPRFALLLVLIAVVLVFVATEGDTFPTSQNLSSLVGSQTVPIVLAVAVMVPLIVGEFDISLAALMGVSSLFLAKLTVDSGIPTVPAIVLTLGAGLVVGGINALLVVYLRLNSFIITLGGATILAGVAELMSNTIISGVPSSLTSAANESIFGLPLSAYVAVIVALIVAYCLSQTAWGRSNYAVGAGLDAAQLAGIPTARIRAGAFILGGFLAALAGVLQTARVGAADPTLGPEFLLPAFAAAFLGATMGRGGRYTVVGTLVAIALLAVGINGLELLGVPSWVEQVFDGVALVLAVLLANVASRWFGRVRRAKPAGEEVRP
jgi:ribose transport system permease protein